MFAFYDYETTGTSPTFDQPTQFAAILTDDQFNEVDLPPEAPSFITRVCGLVHCYPTLDRQ
jgi:exonuclease I